TSPAQYSVIHTFANATNNGAAPYGSLTQSASILYGMTYGGGPGSYGTIFRMNTDGSGYTNLHNFTSGSEGCCPRGSLTLAGSILYGMTKTTVFKISND